MFNPWRRKCPTLVLQKRPACAGPFRSAISAGSVAMVMQMVVMRSVMMAAMVPVNTVTDKPDRLQVNAGDTGGDIQTGLALHADRLQTIDIARAANQKVAAESDAHRRVRAHAAVAARERAASQSHARRTHRPGELGLLGETKVQT